jgi:hypothetical protein
MESVTVIIDSKKGIYVEFCVLFALCTAFLPYSQQKNRIFAAY